MTEMFWNRRSGNQQGRRAWNIKLLLPDAGGGATGKFSLCRPLRSKFYVVKTIKFLHYINRLNRLWNTEMIYIAELLNKNYKYNP